MNEPCQIKSYPHGILLSLNPDMDISDLLYGVCEKFHEARNFFGNVSLVLAYQGRKLSDEELNELIECIELNSDIRISLVSYGNGELFDKRMIGAADRFYFEKKDEHARIITSSVKSGARISEEESIVVIGDVQADATVKSGGNVIVLGSMAGNVYAGENGNQQAYILVSSVAGGTATIAGMQSVLEPPKKSFFRRQEENQQLLYLENGKIVREDYWEGFFTNRK